MKKTILAVCIALSIFMCSSVSAFAAICSKAPDFVHHFDGHMRGNELFYKDGGTHEYLYGYIGDQPIYKNDCKMTLVYQYCIKTCKYCGTRLDGSVHGHQTSTMHSINHIK